MPPKPRKYNQSLSNLAETLVGMRARSKRTQAEVAAKMGTTQTAIARLESGRQSPSVDTLQNYARANGYCLEIGFLASGDADPRTGCILVIDGSPNSIPALRRPRISVVKGDADDMGDNRPAACGKGHKQAFEG